MANEQGSMDNHTTRSTQSHTGWRPRDSVINPTSRRSTLKLPRQCYRHCFQIISENLASWRLHTIPHEGEGNTQRASAAALTDDDAAIKRISKLEAKPHADPSRSEPLLPVIQLARHACPQVVHKQSGPCTGCLSFSLVSASS